MIPRSAGAGAGMSGMRRYALAWWRVPPTCATYLGLSAGVHGFGDWFLGHTFKGDLELVEADVVVCSDGYRALDAVAGGVGIDQSFGLAIEIDRDVGS